MQTTDDYIATLVYSEAVGQRPHGHFDHNANCATGPHSPTADRQEIHSAEATAGQSGKVFHISYEAFGEEGTGEAKK